MVVADGARATVAAVVAGGENEAARMAEVDEATAMEAEDRAKVETVETAGAGAGKRRSR